MYFKVNKFHEFDYPEEAAIRCPRCAKEERSSGHIKWTMTRPYGIGALEYLSFQSVWTQCSSCSKKKGRGLREMQQAFGYLPQGLKAESVWVDRVGHLILALLLLPLIVLAVASLF